MIEVDDSDFKDGKLIDKKMARALCLPAKAVKPLTLQDLIDFAEKHKVDPKKVVLVTRESCAVGRKQYDLLLKPQLNKRASALDPIMDEYIDLPLTISLIKPWWL